jgi:hypothetical protein
LATTSNNELCLLLKTGNPASTVLLDVRRAWLKNSNNPLGLPYAYHGGMDAALAF